ncbi:hypothetical protein SteCoe_6414 [Stentor coeruleus]|uniref:Rhodanese domain-containing protein n=1 Tax=Stentor coeruleus TaxID=5963 RepID=A0A1R2CPX6_9CILI|nr:hypothetical protein SteCoe_6414 [Stentor coeruleus]
MASKLITTRQLFEALKARKPMHILDTTYTLPDISPLENHFKHRIESSKFLDMKEISDQTSGLTMTMPSQEHFINTMRKLHVKNDTTPVILYDLFNMTSPRAWFMFKVFGRNNVAILDGGLSKWISDSLPVISGKYELPTTLDQTSDYSYIKNSKLFRTFEDIVKVSKDKSEEIIDSRPAKSFQESSIPNSFGLPFDLMYKNDKTFKKPEELKELFEKTGVDFKKNIIHSCRIGHSACVNLFAMDLVGKESFLYDGSWEEWSKKIKIA